MADEAKPKLREITQAEYLAHKVSGSNSPFTTERRWFAYENMLGIVLLDNVDCDWSFVALDKNRAAGAIEILFDQDNSSAGISSASRQPPKVSGCESLAFRVGTSYPPQDVAIAALEVALRSRP